MFATIENIHIIGIHIKQWGQKFYKVTFAEEIFVFLFFGKKKLSCWFSSKLDIFIVKLLKHKSKIFWYDFRIIWPHCARHHIILKRLDPNVSLYKKKTFWSTKFSCFSQTWVRLMLKRLFKISINSRELNIVNKWSEYFKE